jgi:hypothetical protein
MSNLTVEHECSGDTHEVESKGEGGQLSDSATEDDVISIFSAGSSNGSDSSVETAITENEHFQESVSPSRCKFVRPNFLGEMGWCLATSCLQVMDITGPSY